MTLLVPGQLTDQVVGTGGGIDTEESDDVRLITQLRLKSVLPIPDRGGGDANDVGDIFLVQIEFETATTEMIAESDGGG